MSIVSDGNYRVSALHAFNDNYIWMIDNGVGAIVIDPGDVAPVWQALEARSLALEAVLLTHKHHDHVGGVGALRKRYKLPVYGPARDQIESVTHALKEGDAVASRNFPGLALKVIEVPGHTNGHIVYYAAKQKWLFCGDMLFGAGCGRMMEGTPQIMVSSLAKLTALPDDTLVFSAHEYTISNLRFALEIEPGNPDILKRMREDSAKREKGQPTLPSTMALEKATNPFLRNKEPPVIENLFAMGRLKEKNAVEAFAVMREWKNNYR